MSDEHDTDEPSAPQQHEDHRQGLGSFIRAQRRLSELSQRELAKIANVSDAYVSQLERGLHEPTLKVMRSISSALNVPADVMLRSAGWNFFDDDRTPSVPVAIRADDRLSTAQKQALLTIYESFLSSEE